MTTVLRSDFDLGKVLPTTGVVFLEADEGHLDFEIVCFVGLRAGAPLAYLQGDVHMRLGFIIIYAVV